VAVLVVMGVVLGVVALVVVTFAVYRAWQRTRTDRYLVSWSSCSSCFHFVFILFSFCFHRVSMAGLFKVRLY